MSSPGFHLHILGGGIAGLAAGYYARKQNLPYTLFEAADNVGGNAITFSHNEFLFDSGAHRLHDKDPESTQEIRTLLGPSIKRINAPSQIYDNGRWIDFPLSPWNLLKRLGPFVFFRAGLEVLGTKIGKRIPGESFETFALNTYGKTIAERFLLNYSSKLWGRPCSELSPRISGKRLEGLNLQTFFIETLLGERSKVTHLDGSFWYPDFGIGMIADKMADYCGRNNIRTNARITRILHRDDRITEIELNADTRIPAGHVHSTLPLDVFLEMLDPAPDAKILTLARSLTYRNVVLAAFTVHRHALGSNASIYFPDTTMPFTRIYEPRQRSPLMSPHGATSLVAELSCDESDALWTISDQELRRLVEPHLIRAGLVRAEDLGDMTSHRMPHAYPVQSLDIETTIGELHAYCKGFSNLEIAGRNGCFSYIHIHDLLKRAREGMTKHAARSDAQKTAI